MPRSMSRCRVCGSLSCTSGSLIHCLLVQELCAEMLRYALQNYKVVAISADTGLRRAAKRYPCLIPALLPTLLSALGSLLLPSQEDVLGGMRASPEAGTIRVDLKLLRQLNERAATSAAQNASTSDATAAGETPPAWARLDSHARMFPCGNWMPTSWHCRSVH